MADSDEATDMDEDASDSGASAEKTTQNLAVQRAAFLHAMRDTFIGGKEPAFDYAVVDENSDFDDLQVRAVDDEERYFDSD